MPETGFASRAEGRQPKITPILTPKLQMWGVLTCHYGTASDVKHHGYPCHGCLRVVWAKAVQALHLVQEAVSCASSTCTISFAAQVQGSVRSCLRTGCDTAYALEGLCKAGIGHRAECKVLHRRSKLSIPKSACDSYVHELHRASGRGCISFIALVLALSILRQSYHSACLSACDVFPCRSRALLGSVNIECGRGRVRVLAFLYTHV